MKPIFFILGAICFVAAAFKKKLGAVGTIDWEYLGVACWGIALWVV